MVSWSQQSPQPKRHLDRFSRFCTDNRSVPILYNGTPFSPKKLSLPMGIWTPSNTWFPGASRVLNPNGISIGSAVFAGLTSVTDWPTDTPCYSVGNKRPRVHMQYCDVWEALPGKTGNTKWHFSLVVLVHCQNSTGCCLISSVFLTHDSYSRCCMTPWIL